MTIDRIILKNNKLPKLKKRKRQPSNQKKEIDPSKMVKEQEILVYTPRGLNISRVINNFSKDIEKAIASNRNKINILKQKKLKE